MSEKTEQPTPKKLRDAREKGEIPHSKDMSKAFLLWGCFAYLIFFGSDLVRAMIDMLRWVGDHAYAPFDVVVKHFLDMATGILFETCAPFVGIVIFLGILGEVLHTGLLFAPEKLTPSLKKLNVVDNLKNIFSASNLIEGCKSMLKVVVLTWILWRMIENNIGNLTLVSRAGIQALGDAFGVLLKTMLLLTALVFGIVAVLDLVMQRYLFFRQQKMTKDEVKHEHKDMEGDPHIKQHRQSLRQELLSDNDIKAVRKASVVVTNPIHFAVALQYEAPTTPLPLVTAKGDGVDARRIVAEARDAGVPVIENIMLARALMADARLNDYVPVHLLDAVVEVLRAVRDMGLKGH